MRELISRTPWWGQVLVIFALTRLVTTTIMLAFAGAQAANPWTAAAPNLAEFSSFWDGHWYETIALSGYPSELPRGEDGHVRENAWAFMPVFPGIVRGVMLLTGLGWETAALLVAVLCTAGAMLLLYRLLAQHLPHRTALFGVTLFAAGPVSPILQTAYAESLHALLLALALLLVSRRQYLALLPVIIVMSFTRPTGLAFALFLGLHWLVRRVRRPGESFPPREQVQAAGAAVLSGVSGLAWPGIAALATGSLTAYTDTELAWRAAYIGHEELIPFSGWIRGLNWWFPEPAGIGTLIFLVLVVTAAVALVTPAMRRLGTDIQLWSLSYGLYLLAVFFPQSSTFRLLLPLFPIVGAFAQLRPRWARIALLVLCVVGQIWWIDIAWRHNGLDWTPP